MPIFEYNGNKVNVNDDQINEFAKYHPDAITKIERDGKVYGVRPGDMEAFNARFTNNQEGEQASQIYYQPQATGNTEGKDTGSFIGDVGERLISGAASATGSAFNLLDKGASAINRWTNSEGGFFGDASNFMKSLAEYTRKKSDRYQGKGFTDLIKEGDYSGALGSAVLDATESAPLSMGIMATGGAGLVGAGVLSASDKYDQLKKENPDMPTFNRYANSILTGASESLSEVVGAGTLGKVIRSTLKAGGKKAAADMVKKNFLDKLAGMESKHWITMPILAEGSEEAANALAEYVVDKATGVKRDDNIFETMINAAVPGAMGGAQFVPVVGAGKAYGWNQKRKVTNAYNDASKGIEGLFNEQEKAQFDETIHRFQQNNDIYNINQFLANVYFAKGMNDDQYRALADYTKVSMSYNNYVSYVNDRINEEAKKRMDDIDNNLNKDMDAVVEAYINGDTDNPVFIINGNLVEGELDDDMNPTIDYDKSDDVIYYRDSDGKIQQCDVKSVTQMVSSRPRADLYTQIMEEVRAQVLNEEESDVNFAPGDDVVLPDGRKGNIQSRMEDGRFTVNMEDGTTVAMPYDQLAKPEEAAAQAQAEEQQSEEERIKTQAYPMDKKGKIDYGQITDPQMYHDALINEFGDDGFMAAESKMNNAKKDLETADKKQDPIERLRAKREAQRKVDFFTQVYNMFPQTSDIDNTAQQPVDTDVQPEQAVANSENPVQEDAVSAIPYEDRSVDDTVYDLLDGQMDIDEVNQFIEANKKEADKAVSEIKAKKPKMTTNKADYLRMKTEWQAKMDEAKRKSDYWDSVKANLQEGSMTDAERNQLSVLEQNTPVSAEELAARAIADGSIKLLRDDFKKETGGGNTEANKMFGIFASEAKGGVSIERAGEILTQMDQEAGTNFLDPNDPNAARDVIIDVLSQARTRGDLISYIRNQRDAQRRKEEEAAYNDFAKYTTEAYGMTPEEYQAYEEDFNRNAGFLTAEVRAEIDGMVYDSIKDEIDDYNEIEQQLNNNDYGENEQGGVSEEGTGGNEILYGQPSVPFETGDRGVEGERITGNNGNNENAPAQEEAVGIKEGKVKRLSDDEISTIIDGMENLATEKPSVEYTKKEWDKRFKNPIKTPVGRVRMGEHQFGKLHPNGNNNHQDRRSWIGIIYDTLTSPNIIVEQYDNVDGAERDYKYVFVKSFLTSSGESVTYFTSVTVKKGDMEVVITNHFKKYKDIRKLLKEGKLCFSSISPSGIQTEPNRASASVTTSETDNNPGVSEDKNNISPVDKQDLQAEKFNNDAAQAENEDRNRPLLWGESAKDTSPTNAASANVTTGQSSESGEQSGSASYQSDSQNKKDASAKGTPGKPNVEAGAVTSNLSDSKDNIAAQNNQAKSEESSMDNSEYSDDAYDEWTNGIVYEDAKFPTGVSDENKVEKKQKAGKRTDGVSVKVAFNGNDLHIQIKTGYKPYDKEIVFKDATRYGASDITYVINRGIGTTNDGARLAEDAILELYGKKKLRRGSNFYRPVTSPFLENETSARIAEAESVFDVNPTQTGESNATGSFGTIYTQFKGKAKEAIEWLMKHKGGEAVGALHHKDIGDIDLVWGKEGTGKSDGYGLSKLVKFHPEVLDNLQEIIESMDVVKRTDNRIQLESKTHKASVRLTWNNENKNWLLTAFEKENSASDNTTDTAGTSDGGKRNDTATPQNTVSDSKDSVVAPNSQAKSEENNTVNAEGIISGETGAKIAEAESAVNTNPTDAQKEAGNYKMGHVKVAGFDITIENPAGSVRSGIDSDGERWENVMNNTYGYFRGTKGVDGDHIDVYLSNDIDGWNGDNVYVIDQYNPDGSFDEHKVMFGFNDKGNALTNFLANYDSGWGDSRRLDVTPVSMDGFKKWIDSSHRKTKPFTEYASVKPANNQVKTGGNSDADAGTVNNGEATNESQNNDATENELVEKAKEKIEDVGEKIGGARKDIVRATADRININGETFSKIFPKLDFKKLIQAGLYPKLAAGLKFIYDHSKAKYKTNKKVRGEQSALNEARFIANYAKGYLLGDTSVDYSNKGWVFTDYGKQLFILNTDLFGKLHDVFGDDMFDIDLGDSYIDIIPDKNESSAKWKSVPRYAYYRDGKPIDAKYIVRVGDTHPFTKDELDMAEKYFLDKVKQSVSYQKANPYKLMVCYNPSEKGLYFIGTKIKGKIVDLTPKGKEYSYKYIEEHKAELQAAAERKAAELKEASKEKEKGKWNPDMNLGKLRERVGVDYRNGKSVSAQDVMDKFGFRGIEFGNYVTQKERQKYLNECYDAFMDMADILGISPRAISIDGKLALAIGARGSGNPKAHYESEKNVINLTKTKSAGSLAHEWWHAMDFYFGDKTNLSPSTHNRFGNETREEIKKSVNRLMNEIKGSDYYKRSRALDDYFGGKVYYSIGTELAARAFQDYITKRLIERGQVNDFLSHYTLVEDWDGKMENYPYPIESDGERIRDAFEELFSTIKEKEVDGNSVLYQKADIIKPVASDEIYLRDALVDRLRQSGIDVIDDVEEGQRVLDEANSSAKMQAKRRALDTVSVTSKEAHQPTVVSSADGANTGAATIAGTDSANPATGTPGLKDFANISYNLDTVANSYEKSSNRTRGFITDLSRALGLRQYGASNYGSFVLHNGSVLTLRISNHNAKVSNFDANDELNGLSIVISKHTNKGLVNNGIAHVTEYFYSKRGLEESTGKPLAEIARSIKRALATGEFTDTTGLAERQEVNADTRYFRTASGEAYGFTTNGKIYIDPRIANADTPIHEYAHLWAEALRQGNPKEWKNVVDLMKDTPVWEEVKRNYPELKTDDAIADEVLAQYSGRRGAEKLREEMRKAAGTNGGLIEKANAVAAIQNVRDALNRFWKTVADVFGIHFTTAEEVADKVLKDLLDGVDPMSEARKKQQLDRINETNPMLDDYHTGIRSTGDILNFREAIGQARKEAEDGGWSTLSAYPDVSNDMLEKAIESGKITVYSSNRIADGAFVTPSRMQAEEYAGGGRVYQKEVNVDDVAWITTDEGQLAKVKGSKMPLRFQLNQEVAEIISRAKEDGTYMKAPNGKPSKLTPRQWAQVRTKAFKDWFGDWEKFARIEKLRNSDSVSITGNEIEITDDYRQNKKKALEYGKSLRDTYVNKDTGVSITLGKSGIKEVLNHDYKDKEQIQSIAAIPQIIENSIYIESANNEDTDVNRDVSQYHYYVCGLNIGGVDYTVRAVIAEQSNGDRYYDHKLTRIEKGKLLDSLSGISTPGFNQGISLVSDSKDKRLLSILQTNSSKVVDDNGEPMVVYHGTDKDISSFEMNDGSMGRGVYFTSNWDEAAEYAMDKQGVADIDDVDESKIYECFVNVRDNNQITHSRFNRDDIEILVTDPTQIKSATENVGTFDGNNPDIRYRNSEYLNDIESVNERFNKELERWNNGEMSANEMLHLGNPLGIMSLFMPNYPVVMRQRILRKASETKHNVEINSLRDLPYYLYDPIFVFQRSDNAIGVLTELTDRDGKNICIAIELGKTIQDGKRYLEVNDVRSIHGRDASNIILPIVYNNTLRYADKAKGLSWLSSASSNYQQEIDKKDLDSATKVVKEFENPTLNDRNSAYFDKEKALDYLRISAPIAEAQDRQELDSVTKVVKEFENPALNGRNIDERSYEDGTLLRPVTEEETLNKLNNEKTIRVYRAMQVIDGKLYPPMSAKVEGRLREPININEWEEAEERPELADDKGQFKLNKGNGSSLKAAYNPYIHTSRSPLNDQFSSAQDRDNLVVVEVEIPESELTSGYKAEKAKDPVGELTWHSGPVSSKLKGDKARKVILTRWDKPIRIVPDAEVAKRIAKLLEGEDIVMPSNVVTPSLRSELEKLGVPFIETDNRGKPILNRDGEGSPSDPTYRQRMRDEAVNMGKSLGVEVRIVEDGSALPGKRGKAKGFFDRADNSVTVVVSNHKSIGDVQATILHEIVGHYGLRQMFGERFDDMMDTVYRTLDKETRRRIADVALRSYRGDVRVATEEYLASIAERGVERPGVWIRIKSAIKEFFRSMGIDLRMSDEDIAYMLWKSKNRLKGGDSVPTVIDKIAKDQEIKEELLYRDGLGFGSLLHTPKADRKGVSELAHDFMEKIRNGNPFTHETYIRLREGYQDRMIRMRDFQREIEKETGHKVEDFEDFYTFENQAHSRAQQDIEDFMREKMKPVWELHDEIARAINKPAGEAMREIETYMMIKHGLERNAEMRKREIDGLMKSGQNPSQNDIDKINAKDYSGLTAISEEITGNPGMDEQACGKWAADFESKYNTNPLWDAIRKATGATLDKLLNTGQISKDLYSQIKGMYKYYIPLKEWAGVRATDMYDYTDADQDVVSNPLRRAYGRKTRAGNVLANIMTDYESATMLGYKNLSRQRLLNLARNSGSSRMSVSEQWYTRGFDANGNEIWEPAAATGFTEDLAHNAQVIQDFNENMRALQQSGDAMLHKDVLRLGVPVKKWQEKQHTVRVKEAGKDILIYFNGDPRIAQAINGQNNVKLDNAILRVANRLRKWMMLNYTARNINFILRNFIRDTFYVNTMNFVKYGAGFEAKYLINFPRAFKEIWNAEFKGKNVPEYESFRKNGGMTGYVEVMGYDRYKKEIEKLVKRSEGRNFHVRDFFHAIGTYIERFNSVIENCSRYSVYKTAKQSGMSELKAIEAAKEASVNFNRRGSGQMGAVWAQNAYFFFNASIQGMQNFASAAKNNKARAAMALGFWVALGYTMRMIGAAFSGDDDDDYDNLPDYVRQNNIVIPAGNSKYIMLPLSVEIRALFGLGDMMGQASLGQYKGRDFAGDVALKLVDLLPKSVEFPDRKRNDDETMMEATIKNVSPDAIRPILDAYLFNENYFGKRVTGRNDYNKHVPEWQKVSYGTSKVLIEASRKINEITGGDYATKGWSDNMFTNPSAVEYLFEQYLGGVGKATVQAYKTVEGFVSGDVALRNVPVVSGLTYSTENMIPRNYTNERYRNYVDEHDETASRMRKYKDGLMKGEDLSDAFNSFTNSEEFKRYMVVDMFKKQIDGIYDMAKAAGDDSEVANNLNGYARELKNQMINELDKLDKDEK